jgi:hypothetical protein
MNFNLNGVAGKWTRGRVAFVAFAVFLTVDYRPAFSEESAIPAAAVADAPAQPPPGAGHIQFAGARSSAYGIRPFPAPEGWGKVLKTMGGAADAVDGRHCPSGCV